MTDNKTTTGATDTANQPDDERELADVRAINQQLANELADFIERGIYPMDIWQIVVDTLELLAKRTDTGFNCPEIVRAGVPVMLERSHAADALAALVEAVKRHKTTVERLQNN